MLLALIGALAFTGFVPADPPPGQCAAAAGDLVAVRRDGVLRVSVAGGPFRQLGDGCPRVAVAAGDTEALLADDLHVRAAGEDFRAPLPVGETAGEPSLAVAPGGWVAAAWVERSGERLIAVVVRPDGGVSRSVLDRSPRRGHLSPPRVGIDAAGNATVAWTRVEAASRARIARAAGSGPFAAGDLPGTATGERPGLAVLPSGRTLLAWATKEGLQAQVDGGPPVTVDPVGRADAIGAALTEDGAAVIAYGSAYEDLSVVDRAAGGAWSAPHVVSGRSPLSPYPFGDGSPEDPAQIVAVGPGGRALVAWTTGDVLSARVLAASGTAGGAWGPATPLSRSFREASSAAVTLDADGPRVMWVEDDVGARGARPVADVPADTTPPVFAARLPSRLPSTSAGYVVLRVRVRCPEGCEATLRLRDGNRVGRVLAPGKAATLQLVADVPRNARRLRIELLVSDREGNTVKRAETLRR